MASGQRVGFLGLGLMGRGMAKNLATKGFQVTVWNRSRQRATALEPLGVKVADTPAALMAEVAVACTCVATRSALDRLQHHRAGAGAELRAARRRGGDGLRRGSGHREQDRRGEGNAPDHGWWE